ncbi:MAG: IS110 family transposase [Trebonia sp.]
MPDAALPVDFPDQDLEVVLGADTHRDIHVAAVVTAAGAMLASRAFPATAAGYERMLAWARSHGTVRRAGVECTGSYGQALTRFLLGAGIEVTEVNQPDKGTRRRRGKTDAIDAESAARAVVTGRATAVAKSGDGPVEAMRVLKIARTSAVRARAKAVNQLKAIIVSAPPELREQLAGLGPATLIKRCAALPYPDGRTGPAAHAVVTALRLLARRVTGLKAEAAELDRMLRTLVEGHAPDLLDQPGVGPDTAATLLIAAGDNPGRLHGEAAYAALCGVSPVEASSGKTQRKRLNRGGDRQANAALHRIVISRIRWDDRTRAYLDKRASEGKTRREAIRCLKRYVAREVYKRIRPVAMPPGR